MGTIRVKLKDGHEDVYRDDSLFKYRVRDHPTYGLSILQIRSAGTGAEYELTHKQYSASEVENISSY